MPVEFLTDEQAAAYGRYSGPPSRAELDRYFHLDGKALGLIEPKRRPHNRLGYAVQLTSVHYLGTFPADLDVPTEVIDYLADQLDIDDPSCIKAYREREMTRLQHAAEICAEYGFVDFAAAEADLAAWIDAQAWTSGDGPKALFDAAVVWLRERKVLLPGVTVLARLVARVRDQANQRLWDTLAGLLTSEQRHTLTRLLEISPGERLSDLERLRRGPTRASNPALVRALDRVAELAGIGLTSMDLSVVPPRRVAELARYGLAGKARSLERYTEARKLATLLAIIKLRVRAVDDALELLDLLMVTKLLAVAAREDNKHKLRRLPRTDRAAAKLAEAVKALFAVTDAAADAEVAASVDEVWARIETLLPRSELAAALDVVVEHVPPLEAEAAEEWRAQLVGRYNTVRPFLEMLTETIAFGATPEGAPVLAAMRKLPDPRIHREQVRGSIRAEPGSDQRDLGCPVMDPFRRRVRG